MSLRRLLLTDTPSIIPRNGELIVWLGTDPPPVALAESGRLARARTTAEAVAYVRQSPAELRVALQEPLALLTALAKSDRTLEARAA